MRLSQLRSGEISAAIAAVLLMVSLFLPWFGDRDAWEAFDVTAVLLWCVAVAGVGLAVLTATQSKPDVPVVVAALTAVLAGIVLVVLLYRLADPLDGLGVRVGLYLGLLGTAGVAVGSWLSMRDERPRVAADGAG